VEFDSFAVPVPHAATALPSSPPRAWQSAEGTELAMCEQIVRSIESLTIRTADRRRAGFVPAATRELGRFEQPHGRAHPDDGRVLQKIAALG